MTPKEFDSTGWRPGMKAKYHGDGKIYPVSGVDFKERLIGLKGHGGDESEIYWARCENITLA